MTNIPRPQMQIVHIEDDRPLRDILKMSFMAVDSSINMQQFASGDDALPYIMQNKHTIDLFILDHRLPGSMDGLEIAQMLRKEQCPGSIVLTSAFPTLNPELLQSLKIEFLPKPWHIIEITPRLLQYRLDSTARFRHESAPSGLAFSQGDAQSLNFA